jgi:RimJ/RimL family protein N-acetyltransferase
MDQPQFIIGNKIVLRPFDSRDILLFYKGENDPDIRETLFLAYPVNVDHIKGRIESQIKSRDTVVLSIAEKPGGATIGQTAFFRIDYISRSAIFYLALMDKTVWSKGYGTEATQLMIDYGFHTLNLNRIQLHVFSGNLTAIKIYEKIGFVKEGVLREAMYHHGKYCDFLVMGLLKREWQAHSL